MRNKASSSVARTAWTAALIAGAALLAATGLAACEMEGEEPAQLAVAGEADARLERTRDRQH